MLLSALVYPGVGHLGVKKYVSALVLATAFSIPLYRVVSDIMVKANQVVAQINSGEIPLDITEISASLSQIMTPSSMQALNTNFYVMALVWGIAIVDVYRVSKQKT